MEAKPENNNQILYVTQGLKKLDISKNVSPNISTNTFTQMIPIRENIPTIANIMN